MFCIWQFVKCVNYCICEEKIKNHSFQYFHDNVLLQNLPNSSGQYRWWKQWLEDYNCERLLKWARKRLLNVLSVEYCYLAYHPLGIVWFHGGVNIWLSLVRWALAVEGWWCCWCFMAMLKQMSPVHCYKAMDFVQ